MRIFRHHLPSSLRSTPYLRLLRHARWNHRQQSFQPPAAHAGSWAWAAWWLARALCIHGPEQPRYVSPYHTCLAVPLRTTSGNWIPCIISTLEYMTSGRNSTLPDPGYKSNAHATSESNKSTNILYNANIKPMLPTRYIRPTQPS